MQKLLLLPTDGQVFNDLYTALTKTTLNSRSARLPEHKWDYTQTFEALAALNLPTSWPLNYWTCRQHMRKELDLLTLVEADAALEEIALLMRVEKETVSAWFQRRVKPLGRNRFAFIAVWMYVTKVPVPVLKAIPLGPIPLPTQVEWLDSLGI
jgi:hypothetical protein